MSYYRELNVIDYSSILEKNKSLHLVMNRANNYISELVFDIDFNEIKKQKILLANDEFLVFDIERKSKRTYSLVILPLLFFLSIFSYLIYLNESSTPKTLFYILSFGLLFAIILIVIYIFFAPKKELIFDRQNGLITFPNMFIQKNVTMPFKNVSWDHFTAQGRYSGIIKKTEIIIRSPTNIFYGFSFDPFFKRANHNLPYLSPFLPEETISFLKWYMDKNRPLPPCEIFKPFREKDYFRRKQAGFKKPETKLDKRDQKRIPVNFSATEI